MCGLFVSSAGAEDRVSLPQSEFVKLMAFIDHSKKTGANKDEQLTLCMQGKDGRDRQIVLQKQEIVKLEEAIKKSEDIELKMGEFIRDQDTLMEKITTQQKQERRLSRYKTEFIVLAGVITWLVW